MFDFYNAPAVDSGDHGNAAVSKYCDDLFDAFAESPEAASVIDEFGRIGWTQTFLGFIESYSYPLPAEMSLDDVNQIIFGLFPAKVTTEPESAADIIGELRAFFTFLGREFSLARAKEIVAEFSSCAVDDLKDELSDPENFGIAKSFVMMGMNAGFDMSSNEGAAQFAAFFNAGFFDDSSLYDSPDEFDLPLSQFEFPTQPTVATPKRLTAKERKKREQLRRKKLGLSKRK